MYVYVRDVLHREEQQKENKRKEEKKKFECNTPEGRIPSREVVAECSFDGEWRVAVILFNNNC
jgi:hypothetical protein